MPVKLAHRLAALVTNFLKVEQSTPYGVSSAGIFQVEIPQSRVWPGTATKRACARGAFSEDSIGGADDCLFLAVLGFLTAFRFHGLECHSQI